VGSLVFSVLFNAPSLGLSVAEGEFLVELFSPEFAVDCRCQIQLYIGCFSSQGLLNFIENLLKNMKTLNRILQHYKV
jgi:hypothetical protein